MLPTAAHKRILVIEDEIMMAFLLEEMLLALGYDIAGTAANIDEATKQIAHQSFDAAILDVNLNGKNTFDLAAQLQEKNRPFLFSTGYDAASLPEKYLNCPA
jgi:DNA-binding response OmpR family regulator